MNIKQTKKRGKRIKKILDDNDINNKRIIDTKNKKPSAVILGLNIDPKKILDKNKLEKNKKQESYDNENSESPIHIFGSNEGNTNECSKCSKNEKLIESLKSKLNVYEKNEQINKNVMLYTNNLSFISYKTGKKISIKKTNTRCWWDTYTFETLPCFLPEIFYNNTYHVIGCFCSFNCALAYNLYYLKDSKIYQRKSLVYKLYREMYKLKIEDKIDIKEAPPKEILDEYGGDPKMNIERYRKTFITMNKEYLIFFPPLKPINMLIEEKTTDVDDVESKYILKRNKPLHKGKSMMSLKMNFD